MKFWQEFEANDAVEVFDPARPPGGLVNIHVMPVDDLIDHDDSADCPCGPTVQPEFREDGSNGWLYVHHSLDGREGQ